MTKWKCEICRNEFENFHAQGFDNKIYCPLCFLKKENQELKKQLEDMTNSYCNASKLKHKRTVKIVKTNNKSKEFIKYLEDEIERLPGLTTWFYRNAKGKLIGHTEIVQGAYKEVLQKYKEIIGDTK